MSEALVLRGKPIATDENGYLSLTDMWRVAGEPKHKKPSEWFRILAVKELIAALTAKLNMGTAHNKNPINARRGRRQGGTFAQPVLALAYAEYLSPELGVEVREIALRVYAGDVSVLDEFKRTYSEQLEEDANRVTVREEVRRNNSDLNAILKEVGANHAKQWAAFHNSGYEGLYNGLNENAIHSRKRLHRGQRILDHMGFDELASNMFRTSLAQQHLRKFPVEGVKRACHVHHRMGQRVRTNLVEENLTMPEDLPTVGSINVARKRLKHATGKRLTKA